MTIKSRWTDLGFLDKRGKRGYIYHLYRCDCGTVKAVRKENVDRGTTLSCGCYHQEVRTKHGLCGSPTWAAWKSMKQRCKGIGSSEYAKSRYFGRGITYAPRWEKFEAFLEDMGEVPEGLELDRVDTNGNYEPGNCRWTDRVMQTRNTVLLRSNNKSGYRGVSYHEQTRKWVVWIKINRVQRYLGIFDSKIHAAKAYNAEARKHEGFPLNEV